MTAGTAGEEQHPYVGLRPFRPEDSPWFRGRDTESDEVTTCWGANRVTVLCGASGAGKTSLLQAGLLPRLQAGQADVLPVGRPSRVSAFPVAALPDHNPYTLALLSAWAPGESATRLSAFTVRDYLRERSRRTDAYGDPLPIFAAIDQTEKLFLDPAQDDRFRQAFIDELAEALADQPNLRFLLSIREDSLDDLGRYQQNLGNPPTYELRPFTVQAATDAVRRPAQRAGHPFAPDVAEKLVGNFAPTSGIEPALLQAVCAGFWSALPRPIPARIRDSELDRYGDVPELLTEFCTRAVTAVADEHELPATQLAAWLQRTFITESGARGAAQENPDRTAGLPSTVARALADWHLLKAVRRSGQRWYELQDDSLIEPLQRAREVTLRDVAAGTAAATADRNTASDHLRVAEAAMADGDLELAERQAEAVIRGTDNLRLHAEAESLLGNVELARNGLTQAEARYRHAAALFEALQDTSAVARLLAAIGQTLLAQGRAAEAVESLHAAIRRVPNDLTVQTELGRALWLQGQHTAAVAVLTGVLTVDGRVPDALRTRGEILADLGEAEQALRDLDRVRRPRWPTVRAARALALATLREPSAADEEIGVALTEAPDNGQVLLYAARVGELVGNPVLAANLARRAEAAENPALPPHQVEQARRLQRLGEAEPS